MCLPVNLFGSPAVLFDATVNQAGASQMGALFPATVAMESYPASGEGEGSFVPLTDGGNVCGAIFSPNPYWSTVLLDFAGVGAAGSKTLTVEIGRLKAQGACAGRSGKRGADHRQPDPWPDRRKPVHRPGPRLGDLAILRCHDDHGLLAVVRRGAGRQRHGGPGAGSASTERPRRSRFTTFSSRRLTRVLPRYFAALTPKS